MNSKWAIVRSEGDGRTRGSIAVYPRLSLTHLPDLLYSFGTHMAKTDTPQKLRLRIKSYDHKLIDNSARQIIEAAERNDAKVTGPIPLPTEVKHYTVNRSTFVHKDAREQFELRVHKRLVEILNPSQKIIESLSNLNLPAGVDIEIKMV